MLGMRVKPSISLQRRANRPSGSLSEGWVGCGSQQDAVARRLLNIDCAELVGQELRKTFEAEGLGTDGNDPT